MSWDEKDKRKKPGDSKALLGVGDGEGVRGCPSAADGALTGGGACPARERALSVLGKLDPPPAPSFSPAPLPTARVAPQGVHQGA